MCEHRSLVAEIILVLCLSCEEPEAVFFNNAVAIFCFMIVVPFLQALNTSSNRLEGSSGSTSLPCPATFCFLWTHLVPGKIVQWLGVFLVDPSINVVGLLIIHLDFQLWFLFLVCLDHCGLPLFCLAFLLFLFLHPH